MIDWNKIKYKDANEMFLKEQIEHGYDAARDAVFNCVNDAKWIYKGDVIQFADIENKETSFEGIKTNLEVLDRNLGGSLYGRIILVTGSNKSGKSVLINQLTSLTGLTTAIDVF